MHHMKLASLLNLVVGTGLLATSTLHSASAGSVVVTYAENANAEKSSLSNTNVFDFNNMALGRSANVNWDGVGSFDQLYILNADQYGGATDATHLNGSKYSVQGVGTSVQSSTLTLSHSSGYFGMWWSAGDGSNQLSFYNGDSLVGEFTTSNLLGQLGSEYKGNPRNRGMDSGEPFAFINFFGDKNTTWNKIVVHNTSQSGFESDNYTTRVSTYNARLDGPNVPGIAVARVSGSAVTKLAKNSTGSAFWGSENAVPGAPAPSVLLLTAFGIGFFAKYRKSVAKVGMRQMAE